MDKNRVNIAIVEPSQIVWEGLANLLFRSNPHFFVHRLNSMEELLRFATKEKVNVAIVNPSAVQDKDGKLAEAKKRYPKVDWVALTYSPCGEDMPSGFDSVISITDSPNRIMDKLGYGSGGVGAATPLSEELTGREVEVLQLLIKGLSNKEIAERLSISIHTVISHRKNIVEKTDIRSLSGLTIYAISKKLISLES